MDHTDETTYLIEPASVFTCLAILATCTPSSVYGSEIMYSIICRASGFKPAYWSLFIVEVVEAVVYAE